MGLFFVAENAFIAGKGQYCASAFVGKIRMLFAEFFKDRNQVIVSCGDGAVVKGHPPLPHRDDVP